MFRVCFDSSVSLVWALLVGLPCSGCVGSCDFCLICDAGSWRCSFMGSM